MVTNPLCCFQTSLPHAAFPLWWWYLFNCASATCHREKTKWWAASSQSIDILAALPTAADRIHLIYIQLQSDATRWKGQSGVAADSCNSETASSDQAMKQRCVERQASLNPALLLYTRDRPIHVSASFTNSLFRRRKLDMKEILYVPVNIFGPKLHVHWGISLNWTEWGCTLYPNSGTQLKKHWWSSCELKI